MNDYLKNFVEKKNAELDALAEESDKAETMSEVREIGKRMDAIRKEIQDAEAELRKLPESQADLPAGKAEERKIVASYGAETPQTDDEDMEYRKAFMGYVQRGEMSPILQRDNDRTTSGDLGILIPQTVIQQIITGIESVYGQLYSRVKKTNIKGGVKYPIGSFSATFHRLKEEGVGSAPSDRQNGGAITSYVVFSYNIGEIRLARSILENVLTVPVFEAELTKTIVKAYIEAMDKEIMTGVASNMQCEGILTEAAKVDSRISADNIIEFTEAEMADWTSWQTKLFAKIPLSMRGERPEFVMTPGTYEANIKTLKDKNDRPVYNETFNPQDGTERALFKGHDVIFVEEDILGNFNDIEVGDDATDSPYFGMYWVPQRAYAINSNLEFYAKRYFDEEKNEWVDKALVINDGKVLDPKYIYLLKKVEAEEAEDEGQH